MTEAFATFKPNGTLAREDRAYVERSFESRAWSTLTANEWVTLLGPRKYGKSSALVRLRDRLVSGGYACSFIDVQGYGSSETDYGEFLEWFAESVSIDVGSLFTPPDKRHRGYVDVWLNSVISQDVPSTAIFIDEASGVPDAFRTKFFSQLRAFYNQRGRGGESGQLSSRVVFAFAGTFRPTAMIDNLNSPFNISDEINPDDLTLEQVLGLARLGLGNDGEFFGRRAFEETLGQPFYVQHLLAGVQRAGTDRMAAFEAGLDELRSGTNAHLEHLVALVKADPELRRLVPRILERKLPFRPGDLVQQYALVSGIARREANRLIPRNPIHALALEQFLDDDESSQFP